MVMTNSLNFCACPLYTVAMLPRSSVDILASATFKPRRITLRRSSSGFEGRTSSFAPPSTPALAGDHHSDVGATSQPLSGVPIQFPMVFSSSSGPSHMDGQQEGATRNERNQSRSRVDASITSACSVPSLDPNKPLLCSSSLLSDPSIARSDIGSHPSRMSRAERIRKAHGLLKDGRLSPFDRILEALNDSNVEYAGYQNEEKRIYSICAHY
ncbi:hypothetical protein EDB83DRAFT_2560926 [Lactarius deliciosus]|nr:hypothetical protein EDB83DRAFT_2560926 [Lactarius deliciosus]